MARERVKPVPIIGEETYYNVWVQWKDGPGGKHRCESWEHAIQEAQSILDRGFDKHAILIRKIVTTTFRYDHQPA